VSAERNLLTEVETVRPLQILQYLTLKQFVSEPTSVNDIINTCTYIVCVSNVSTTECKIICTHKSIIMYAENMQNLPTIKIPKKKY